ncbi:MAG: TlpA disulfide reductase family protein [Candidatus Margulisbacteria bacterium]|nr:TlpA disulfide reductase family protein [Candidatus Margulisiibacteriota bacterium]
MLRKAILILAVAIIAIPALAEPVLKIGSPPPPLTLPNLKGENVSLESRLAGKVTVIVFFTSWSKSCQEEIIWLKKLAARQDLQVIGVSFDRKVAPLNDFIKANNITFEVLHDKKLKALKDYRILIIPTLFIFDQAGNLKNIYVDFDGNTKKAVSADIKKLLPAGNPAI